MIFKNLQRNINGSIDADWLQDDGTIIRYTLDPTLGHIEKAEYGEWGVIKEPTKIEKSRASIDQSNATIKQQLTALDVESYVIERAISGDQFAKDKIMEAEIEKAILRAKLK